MSKSFHQKVPLLERKWFVLGMLYLLISLSLALFHGHLINVGQRFEEGLRSFQHYQLITQDAERTFPRLQLLPYAYRILVPYTVEGMNNVTTAILGGDIPFRIEKVNLENFYILIRGLTMFATFVGFHKLLECYVETPWALGGTFFLAAIHGPTFIFYWYQPSSPLDLCLWIWAAYLTIKRKDWYLFPIMLVGAFNRETIVFMILVHFALRYGNEPLKKLFFRCTILGVIWASVFFGMRIALPMDNAEHANKWVGFLNENLSNFHWQQYAFIFVCSWAFFPIFFWKKMPPELKRLVYTLIPYIALIFLFGRIREVRLFLPLCIPMIPATMLFLKERLENNPKN